jgi:CDP-diglyceride synthetase
MPSVSVVAPIFLQWSMRDDEFIRGNPFNILFDAHGIIKQVIIEFQVGLSKPLHDLFESIFPRLEGN